MAQTPLLIVTDVDGTLLGPGEVAAIDACRRLATRTPVILASSRTVAELARLQQLWQLTGPVIAENGAVIATATDDAIAPLLPGLRGTTETASGARLLSHLAPSIRRLEEGIARLTPTEHAGWMAAAALARAALDDEALARWHSVLVPPSVPEAALEHLRTAGLSVEPGGRWVQVATGASKGDALVALRRAWRALHGGDVRIWAIGDDANDGSLLAAADVGWVINRPVGGHHPVLAAMTGVQLLAEAGPHGWVEMATAAEAQLTSGA
jgi:predicted mannosyl-3-phosphoglycerate phosphatase (HAD superfamily)